MYKTYSIAYENIGINEWQQVVSHPVYIGSNRDFYTITEEVIIEASTRWEKKKADRNCLSADPNDCLVWCLVEVPAETKTIKTPLDLQNTPSSDISFITTRSVQKGGYIEWREVLCGNQVTSDRIAAIQRGLRNAGYDFLEIDNTMGHSTKNALVDFQRKNGLPIGALDYETLNALGVNKN